MHDRRTLEPPRLCLKHITLQRALTLLKRHSGHSTQIKKQKIPSRDLILRNGLQDPEQSTKIRKSHKTCLVLLPQIPVLHPEKLLKVSSLGGLQNVPLPGGRGPICCLTP